MATVNLTRNGKFAEKKNVSVAAATVLYSDIPGTDNYELFKLPADCVIIGATVFPETAGQATLTADLGYAGGTELGSNLDLDDVAIKGGALATRLATGTGKTVTIKPDAAPTAGKFHIMVEYIEYTRGNGEYAEYSAS
jgi:hypothetical protein